MSSFTPYPIRTEIMNHFMTSSFSGGRVCILNPPDDPIPSLDALSVSPSDSIFNIPSEGVPTAKHSRLHQCSECGKVFSSSGHRSRHFKLHGGQKSHHCPFPGCGMSCSRHDNLMQHFRVHLPKSERKRDTAFVRNALAQMDSSVVDHGDALSPWSTKSPSHAPLSDFCGPPVIMSSPSSFSLPTPSPTVAEKTISPVSSPFFSSTHSGSTSIPWEAETESQGHVHAYHVSFVRGE